MTALQSVAPARGCLFAFQPSSHLTPTGRIQKDPEG